MTVWREACLTIEDTSAWACCKVEHLSAVPVGLDLLEDLCSRICNARASGAMTGGGGT